MLKTRVISGFPAIGKTSLVTQRKDLKIIDIDSSNFTWLSPGIRNPNFPNNYVQYIKECIGEYDIILISIHYVSLTALNKEDIKYEIFYPCREDKETYLERCRRRNNDEKFINLINNKWEDWILEIEENLYAIQHQMKPNTFLVDYI